MEQSKPDLRVAACLPLLCSMRSGEVRNLRVGDVDLSLGKLWVRQAEDLVFPPIQAFRSSTSCRCTARRK